MVCTISHTIYSSGMCVGGLRIEFQTVGRRPVDIPLVSRETFLQLYVITPITCNVYYFLSRTQFSFIKFSAPPSVLATYIYTHSSHRLCPSYIARYAQLSLDFPIANNF